MLVRARRWHLAFMLVDVSEFSCVALHMHDAARFVHHCCKIHWCSCQSCEGKTLAFGIHAGWCFRVITCGIAHAWCCQCMIATCVIARFVHRCDIDPLMLLPVDANVTVAGNNSKTARKDAICVTKRLLAVAS